MRGARYPTVSQDEPLQHPDTRRREARFAGRSAAAIELLRLRSRRCLLVLASASFEIGASFVNSHKLSVDGVPEEIVKVASLNGRRSLREPTSAVGLHCRSFPARSFRGCRQ